MPIPIAIAINFGFARNFCNEECAGNKFFTGRVVLPFYKIQKSLQLTIVFNSPNTKKEKHRKNLAVFSVLSQMQCGSPKNSGKRALHFASC